ncbi:MAG: ATP-binding protein [Desulfobulbaceae bacterium]|nr:ATP-binding protein [Desulfobulbaceae bacterium]
MSKLSEFFWKEKRLVLWGRVRCPWALIIPLILEVMRQPLEDAMVTISRASTSLRFPARFMLVAAMNPCPCGYYGDPDRECACTPVQIQRYQNRLSGPLLDRIDMHVEVPAVKVKEIESSEKNGSSSADMRQRVNSARQIQGRRYAGEPTFHPGQWCV